MSYKQCIFGVPTERITQGKLLAELAATAADLGRDIDLPDVYVLLNDDAQAQQVGLRLFLLGRTVQKGTMVERGFLEEALVYGCEIPLVTLLHDDQHGIHLFRYSDPAESRAAAFLLSDGPQLGGRLDGITVPYSQRGLSAKAMAKLEDYDTAVKVGLRQHFPRLGTVQYLDLLYAKQAIHLYSPGKGIRPQVMPTPPDWHNMMAFWPEDGDWRAAKIPPRDY